MLWHRALLCLPQGKQYRSISHFITQDLWQKATHLHSLSQEQYEQEHHLTWCCFLQKQHFITHDVFGIINDCFTLFCRIRISHVSTFQILKSKDCSLHWMRCCHSPMLSVTVLNLTISSPRAISSVFIQRIILQRDSGRPAAQPNDTFDGRRDSLPAFCSTVPWRVECGEAHKRGRCWLW